MESNTPSQNGMVYDEDTISLVDLLAVVVRHRGLIILGTVAVGIIAAAALYLLPIAGVKIGPVTEFTAERRIMVNPLPPEVSAYLSLDAASTLRNILQNPRFVAEVYTPLEKDPPKDRSQEQFQTLIRRTIIGKAYSIGYDGSTRIFTLSYKNGTPEDAVAFLDAVVHAIGPELTDQVRPLVQEAQAAIEISLEDTIDSLARVAEQAVQDAMTDIPLARLPDSADGVQLPCTESIVSYLDNNPTAIRATMEMMRSVTRLERIVQDATSMYIVLGGATAFEETTGSRSTTVIIATITAFFLTVFLAFVLEYVRRVKADPEEMAKLRAAWRRE